MNQFEFIYFVNNELKKYIEYDISKYKIINTLQKRLNEGERIVIQENTINEQSPFQFKYILNIKMI